MSAAVPLTDQIRCAKPRGLSAGAAMTPQPEVPDEHGLLPSQYLVRIDALYEPHPEWEEKMEIELAHPPATHVWTGARTVTRIDALTLEEARAVIIRLCDDLETARRTVSRLQYLERLEGRE